MQESKKTRQHETVIEIPTTVENVWRAITSAGEVQAWFAERVRIRPEKGGEYAVSWGEGMEGSGRIDVFDAPHHLRVITQRELTKKGEQPGETVKLEPVQVAMDYYVEAKGGTTTLRLVHSGFLESAEWDQEFDGTRKGWPMMFRILRYGVTHFPGVAGQQVWFYAGKEMPIEEAFQALTALLGAATPEYNAPPEEYCAAWNEMGDGLVYFGLGSRGAKTGISICVVLYGDAATRIGEAKAYWQEGVDRALEKSASPTPA